MTRIRLTDVAELITLLPYQLGFHPHRSLVVADLTGGRLHGVARMDLAVVRSREDASECFGPLVRDGAREVVLAAWEEEPRSATRALDLACHAAHDLELDVVRELLVRGGRFWSSGDDEPPEGRVLPDPGGVAGVAEFVALGIAPLPGRESLAQLLEASGHAPEATVFAVSRRRGCAARSWSSPAARRMWHRYLTAAAAGDPRTPSHRETAVLAVALLDRDWRDGLIAWLCRDSLPLTSLRAGVGRDLPGLPRIPRCDAQDPPDSSPGRAVLESLLVLSRSLPDQTAEAAAAVLTLVAHVAWWLGDGALARTALDRALRVCPGYRLAELFEQVVAVGLRPALFA